MTGSEKTVRKTLGNVSDVVTRGAPVVVDTDSPGSVEQFADYVFEVRLATGA